MPASADPDTSTAALVRAYRATYSLTQEQFAAWVTRRFRMQQPLTVLTVKNWERGKSPNPLIEGMLRHVLQTEVPQLPPEQEAPTP